jgi:GT2 family glycosyltransferase
MVLIAMCVFSTEENRKDVCLEKTLISLKKTVNLKEHRLFLSINGLTSETLRIIHTCLQGVPYGIVHNSENLGTAKGINRCWSLRQTGEHCLKMDDDIVIYNEGWLNILVEALSRDPSIGQIGLKRKDLAQNPNRTDWAQSKLVRLPHSTGQIWIDVEFCDDIMGSCVLHSGSLIDKTGGLFQCEGNLYGFDDNIKSIVSMKAGFKNCFYPHVQIDHIDNERTGYVDWKQENAAYFRNEFDVVKKKIFNGKMNLYTDMGTLPDVQYF